MTNSSQIIFATGNKHKIEEISRINQAITFLSLTDVNILEDIPETGDTFRANAKQKAQYVFSRRSIPTLAEDSGLVIAALNGEPGILSARYAGEDKNHQANIEKVLRRLSATQNRDAYFISTLCFILNSGEVIFFEGKCHGVIAYEPRGAGGFGYDPIFIPNGYDQSFAVLPNEVKDAVSHRRLAFEKFAEFITP